MTFPKGESFFFNYLALFNIRDYLRCQLSSMLSQVRVQMIFAFSNSLIVCGLLPEVLHLSAEPDFRDVTLRWEYERQSSKIFGFHVHYCELQAWGPHRCRSKV
jgi:hypothetical protein